ncbi:MAG: hypothetical protein ACLGHC_06810 [Alphaproteobacteria bacterium]
MRAFPLIAAAMLAGCSTSETGAPSLLPRPAEAIDPRVPVPETSVSPDVSPALAARLDALVGQAVAGDEAFRAAAERAENLARSAGPAQSESWIVAQQALSAAIAAREPVARGLGDIDSLAAESIAQKGGLSAADLAAVRAAAERVGEIDAREAAAIEHIQALLAR